MVLNLTLKKVAVIVGVTGQDGAYLCGDLLDLGYEIYGVARRLTTNNKWRLAQLGHLENPRLNLLEIDITEPSEVSNLISGIQPLEVYNLASHSYVADSFTDPYESAMVSGIGTLNILQSIVKTSPSSRFFQAGSSEMFGQAETSPQNEDSKFNPRNIYASAKLFSNSILNNFREVHGMFASTAILYNHESPLRAPQFVTRKISNSIARISLGESTGLEIGNLDAVRDWGYAPEYVTAMRQIINFDSPETFVLATGTGTSVREFVRLAFQSVDLEIEFQGSGLEEKGIDKKTGRELVSVNAEYFRPAEKISLIGNPGKAEKLLGWKASKAVSDIIQEMVEADVDRLKGSS